jgi:3-oxoacyl-[acyl-carrier-protein] synthase II
MLDPREVWITGAGAVTAAGAGIGPLGDALAGEGSDCSHEQPDGERWLCRAPDPQVGRAGRRLSRQARLLLAAAREAWADAGLARAEPAPARVAVIEGTSLGPLADVLMAERQRLAESSRGTPHAVYLVRMMFDAGSAALAQEIRAAGAVHAVSAGSVSGALAIVEGFWKVRFGLADVAVAGGAECPLDPGIIDVFAAAGLLAAPGSAGIPCRPFDVDRCGTVLGEGAGVLVLEAAEHAARRGARARAVLAGAGLSCESCSMVAPDPSGRGLVAAARQALADTPLDDVGWIKTHGTGTRSNDLAECRGLATLFGGRLPRVPLTSLKPLLGHCLGASGSVEAVAAVLSLERELVPPTLGTTRVDPTLPPCTVALRPLASAGPAVLLLSESFGGRCGALLLRRAP